ncbi:nucleotide exchange factor GrpE [Halobacteriales archaeon QH_6_64_20]|jgi:molecular chaperone GrpE|nr:MAG: nucleotide exchange factor GrpE [Halobacteriales archaeon QH_6_64_20]
MTEHDATGANESADDGRGVDADHDSDGDVGPSERNDGEAIEPEASTEDGSTEATTESEDFADLAERIGDASDEQIAREIASLRALVSDLETRESGAGTRAETQAESEGKGEGDGESRDEPGAETETDADRIADLESKLARKQADFENYKKRLNRRREQERERATEDLVTRLLGVRDDLVRALSQEGDADIRGGVETTLEEFDRVLGDEGVAEIDPEPGTEIDPQRHEVMMRVDSDFPEGRVAEVFRPGYEMGEKVLRPAQVTVSEGGAGDGDADGENDG